MDWRTLFLTYEGRIDQKDYWLGALILFVIGLLASALHILAPLIWLALIYPWICVIAKRLHDFGKSGWLILLPIVIACLALTAGAVLGVFGAIAAFVTGSGWDHPGAWGVFLGALGAAFSFFLVAGLAKLVFLIWVGLARGDPGPNRYGPPPTSLTSPRPTPAA